MKVSLRPARSRAVSRDMIAAHVEAEMLDALHSGLGPEHALRGMNAMAAFARNLSGYLRLLDPAYGEASERVFFRSAGLAPDGSVPPWLLRRVEEVAGDAA